MATLPPNGCTCLVSFDVVLFDLGRVVLDWVPERPFEQVLAAAEVPAFMERVDFYEWNRQADNGRSYEEIEAEWCARFPGDTEAILAYRRFNQLAIPGLVPGVWALVAELQQHCIRVGALSNWSADTFPQIRERFAALSRFDTMVVSGFDGVAKPDRAMFALACDRNQVEPHRAVFIDDLPANVAAARASGLTGLLFSDAAQLRADLLDLGLPVPGTPQTEPIYHWSLATDWVSAQETGRYPWSTRGVPDEATGFVHFSYADQVPLIRQEFFAGLAEDELVLLRLDPQSELPVLVEDGFPHLYAPLPVSTVVPMAAHELGELHPPE
jgi:2-haloacid dehalogenase